MKVTLEDIHNALQDHPLTQNGYTVSPTYYGTPSRENSVSEPDGSAFDLDQVQAVVDHLLATYPKTKTTGSVDSYGLKHVIEANLDGVNNYVSNGTTILAALVAGYQVARAKAASPNAVIGIPRRIYEKERLAGVPNAV